MFFLFLEDNNLLTPNQSGFRPNDICINQLLSIVHSIYSDFDHNPSLEVRANFLDISTVFDKVWHDGLFYKLENFGISGNLLKLFHSYLNNRQQRVVLMSVFQMGTNISWCASRFNTGTITFLNLH